MSLPEQIQKQVAEAQAIIEQHYGPQEDTPPVEPVVGSEDPPASTPSEEAAPVASVQNEQSAPKHEDENSDTYAQRWKSLQGIYNVTVAKAQQAEARVSQLEQLISAMQTAPAPQAQPAAQAANLSADDKETFGDDLVEMVNRVAGGAVHSAVAPLMQSMQALERQLSALNGVVPVVQNVAAQQRFTREERFFQDLAKHVPDWERINANQAFHTWLLSPDPLTGILRQTYLTDAQSTFDVQRTVALFNAWKGATGTPQGAAPQPTRSAVSELEKQVAPGRAAAAAPAPVTKQGKQWSPADIAKFYDDKRRGVYTGRDEEAKALERDIFDAQREGRIALNAA